MSSLKFRARWASLAAVAASTLVIAMLGATPAQAIDLPFDVVSPAEGSTTTSRDPLFSGTGFEGATVTVTPTAGQADPVTVTVLPDGTWTTPAVTFGPAATTAQQAVVTHTPVGGVAETATVNFVLPAVPSGGAIVITSPAQNSTLTSSALVVEGTAPAGSLISYQDPQGGEAPMTFTVDASGTFELPFLVPYSDFGPLQVPFTGTTSDGLPLTPATLTINPAPLLDAPVITSPATGAALSGSSVTFTGTGIPGRLVAVSAYSPGVALPDFANYARVSPNVVVDAQGNWSATITLLPASYRAFASHIEVTAPDSGFVISDFSPEISFSLAAAVVPAQLAATGFDAGAALPAALLLLLGGGALVLSRRRLASAAQV